MISSRLRSSSSSYSSRSRSSRSQPLVAKPPLGDEGQPALVLLALLLPPLVVAQVLL
jgi:hypothetical protein